MYVFFGWYATLILHYWIIFAHSNSFLFKLNIMLPVQKYRQTKNQGLLEFLKNNQMCAIKKTSKKYGGITIKKKRYKKKQYPKKWNSN